MGNFGRNLLFAIILVAFVVPTANAGLVQVYINNSEDLVVTENPVSIKQGKDFTITFHVGGPYRIESGDDNLSVYNLNMDADENQWRTYIENNLLQLWSKTRLALGFNMLSAHSLKRQKTLYYADPEHFLAFCTKTMNGRVQLVNRLAPEEFVIFILRKESLKNSNG